MKDKFISIFKNKYYIYLSPFLLMFILLFFSCLVPPTKIDEITYHLYYTKMAVLGKSFKLLYSPFALFTYMGAQTYNIWVYHARALYAPALNSLFCLGLSFFVLISWAKERFGKNIAILAGLVAFCSL